MIETIRPRFGIGWFAVGCLLLAAGAGGAARAAPQASEEPPLDLIIRGGRVFDGSGNPWILADVGIQGERIVAVGDLSDASAEVEIEATGLYVAPGFIDVHSHALAGLITEDRSAAATLLYQGLTTVVINPDGGGGLDIGEQRDALLAHGLGVNVAQMVGHGTVRGAVLGMEDRAPTADELAQMMAIVRGAMEDGAFGLSSGLFYTPGSYAELDEVIELAKVVAELGGAYGAHIRDEADYTIGVVAAVDEVIQVAREAGIPGVVTHIKALGPNAWGESETIVERDRRGPSRGRGDVRRPVSLRGFRARGCPRPCCRAGRKPGAATCRRGALPTAKPAHAFARRWSTTWRGGAVLIESSSPAEVRRWKAERCSR